MSEIGERLARLEQQVQSHDNRLSNKSDKIKRLEDNNETLIRLAVISETQNEMNKKQNEALEKFGVILGDVGTNLSLLNNSHEQLKAEVDGVGIKIREIEDGNKIDIPKLIGQVIVTLIVGWAIWWFGAK